MDEGKARSLLLALELLDVEVEFAALEDVAIKTAGLSGAGRDAGEQVVGIELVGNLLFDLACSGGAALKHGLDVIGALGLGAGLVGLFNLLLVKLNVVVLEEPLSEGGGVDSHDAVLDEGLGTDELVVGSVVHNIDDTGLAADGLRAPGEVTGINTESAVLKVTTTAADHSHLLVGAELGHSGHSTH